MIEKTSANISAVFAVIVPRRYSPTASAKIATMRSLAFSWNSIIVVEPSSGRVHSPPTLVKGKP